MNDQTPSPESRDDANEPGALYAQVLTSTRQLIAPGRSVTVDEIASHAWAQLTTQQRADAVPTLMASYTSRVHHEENQTAHARAAADPDLTTYLGDFDEAILWDAYTEPDAGPEATTVDRKALLNILCEVELLRHRLAMANHGTKQD